MTTYVFAWNPKLWNWPELERDARRIVTRGYVDIEWACGRVRAIERGSRAFFVRVGVAPKGLIASGHTLSEPREDRHWIDARAAQGATTHYVKLRLEFLGRLPVITLDELARPPFGRFRWAVRQSGTRMPTSIADLLEPWWEKRTAGGGATPPAAPAPRPTSSPRPVASRRPTSSSAGRRRGSHN